MHIHLFLNTFLVLLSLGEQLRRTEPIDVPHGAQGRDIPVSLQRPPDAPPALKHDRPANCHNPAFLKSAKPALKKPEPKHAILNSPKSEIPKTPSPSVLTPTSKHDCPAKNHNHDHPIMAPKPKHAILNSPESEIPKTPSPSVLTPTSKHDCPAKNHNHDHPIMAPKPKHAILNSPKPEIPKTPSPSVLTPTSKHDCPAKNHKTPSFTRLPSSITSPPSTTTQVDNPLCWPSENPHPEDPNMPKYGWCVCSGGIRHPATQNEICPQLSFPWSWYTWPSPAPNTTLTNGENVGYLYTYNEPTAGGAKIACETSKVANMALYGAYEGMETVCSGSTTTLTTGVSYVTTATGLTVSPVLAGNWVHSISESPVPSTSSSSEVAILVSSIYNALSTICSDSGTPTTTVIPVTKWNDNKDHMWTVTETQTMTACATDTVEVIDVWYIDSDESNGPQQGTLKISVIESWFTAENLKEWMLQVASIYAKMAMSRTTYESYDDGAGYSEEPVVNFKELAQHHAPRYVGLIYKWIYESVEVDLGRMWTHLTFQPSEEDLLECVSSEEMIQFFASLCETFAPELAGEIQTVATKAEKLFLFVCEKSDG
ncbi:hypothetical protein N7474_004084 [Penicillium riverlandense]|uniref:uncharacterized protein n=1 Tax=Penicillium riverlandense TaxID=1903569 RepID=UPI0025491012|nr:uncharacterized protein N7474_004084 [Penicillium riverlandense]KAJ5818493.1 hypothetical protein N7474_004084 [Penicillium riverlandense]